MDKAIAILSDIHGNIWALEEVWKDIQRRGISEVYNLGDSYYGPLEPRITHELLTEICPIQVLGNEDIILIPDRTETTHHIWEAYTRDQLDSTALETLTDSTFSLQYRNILLCHGTPTEPTTYLVEDVSHGWPVERSHDEIRRMLEPSTSGIVCCGHSHLPQLLRIDGTIIINPGSVGLQAYTDDYPVPHKMARGNPHTMYAILELNDGEISMSHIEIPYPREKAVTKAKLNGSEEWAYWLETGRVKR